MKTSAQHLAVAGMTALAPVSWGTTYVVVTELLPDGRPLLVAAARVVPAGLVLAALGRRRSRRPGRRPALAGAPATRPAWPLTVLAALCNFGLFFPLLAVAIYRLPGGVAAAVGGVQPLLVAGGTWIAGGGRPRAAHLAVGAAAAVGVALVVLRPGVGLDAAGIVAAAGANASFAAGVVLTRRFPVAAGEKLADTGRQLLLGGAVLVPLALAVEGAPPVPTAAALAGFAYLSLVATALAFVLWFDGVRRLPPVAPPLLGLAAPATGAATGWVLLGQSLSPVQLTGFAVILGAIAHGAWLGGADDRRGQLPGRQEAVAVGEQLGDLGPVDAGVDHHAHCARRRARAEERVPAAVQHVELGRGRAEQQQRVRPRRRIDGEHVGEGAPPDAPPGARPGLLLPRLR
jgi:probable blue pigment (indigoidine) exporter